MKLDKEKLLWYSGEYSYYISTDKIKKLKPEILERGYLLKEELSHIARWKSPRSAGKTKLNSENFVNEVTKCSFKTSNERLRIESLLLLDGIGYPTASTILHFFHRDKYPILDFRAIWSIGMKLPSTYNFTFWWEYVRKCRNLSEMNSIDMRTLDQALWQYSKEHQPTK